MRKWLFVLLLWATQVYAVEAFWTGQFKIETSITGRMVWNCEYQYAGQRFWRTFESGCPSSIDIA